MSRILAILLLLIAPVFHTAYADDEDVKESGGFNALEIFNTDPDTSDSSSAGETTSATLVEEGEAADQNGIVALILRAINILTLLVGTFAFIMIVIAGVMLVSAQGDQGKIDRAKGIIVQAIAGLFVVMFSYIIVTFVQSFLY
jgi:hypothetical protein